MIALVITALVFLAIVLLIVGIWWAISARQGVRRRLAAEAVQSPAEIFRVDVAAPRGGLRGLVTRTGAYARLHRLVAQSAAPIAANDVLLVIAAFAFIAGSIAWLRTGQLLWGLGLGLAAGSLPVLYLLYRRQRRFRRFEGQLPEALDMISQAIRAGNALSAALRLVGEEMPEPVGAEFRTVSEEIRLGADTTEALIRMQSRVPIEDMTFFCTAITIQRASGGNLAEILDRLAEVIRERFKILSYARALAAQHKWSAILVGLSPLILGAVFELIRPGYFDDLLKNPIGPLLLGGGLLLEGIGFLAVWKIAQIKV